MKTKAILREITNEEENKLHTYDLLYAVATAKARTVFCPFLLYIIGLSAFEPPQSFLAVTHFSLSPSRRP
jgi:hypothetical protein